MMCADPLAPLPVVWSAAATAVDINTRDPKFWAEEYEKAGASDLFSKLKALAENSSRHRIVGCGLKAWVSKTTTQQQRGHIEAGLFKVSRSRFRSANGTTIVGRGTANYEYANTGVFGTALNHPTYRNMMSSIEQAKSQHMGLLPSEDGVTLRWVDANNFEYVDTVYRSLVAPSKTAYTNGYVPFIATHNTVTSTDGQGGFAGRVLHDVNTDPNEEAIGPTSTFYFVPTTFDNVSTGATGENPSGGPTIKSQGTSRLGYFMRSTAANTAGGLGASQEYCIADASNFPNRLASENVMGPMFWADDKQNFSNGLYADIQGIEANQQITIQVVWHVEYIPTHQALDYGLPSPVDMNFESLSVMAGDETSFPVVVKGHSFFKSLARGLRQAANGAARVLGVASNIAKIVPIPQVQAAGTFMGMGSTIAGGISTVF
jgi:hypothetical protein